MTELNWKEYLRKVAEKHGAGLDDELIKHYASQTGIPGIEIIVRNYVPEGKVYVIDPAVLEELSKEGLLGSMVGSVEKASSCDSTLHDSFVDTCANCGKRHENYYLEKQAFFCSSEQSFFNDVKTLLEYQQERPYIQPEKIVRAMAGIKRYLYNGQ